MSWRPCSFGSASPAPSLPLAVLRWGKCLGKPTQSLSGAQTYQNQNQKCQLGRAVNRISQGSPGREAAVSSGGSQHLNSELMCLESNVPTKALIPDTVRDMPKMPTHSCPLALPVPAAVTNLKITENSTRHLSFSWTASEGELSGYNIFLYNPDKTLQERAQADPLVQSFSFQNLLQGRMYKVVIVTHSGELSNESFIFGRTGKT